MRVDEGERPSLSAESHLNPFLIKSLRHMIYLHPLTQTHTLRATNQLLLPQEAAPCICAAWLHPTALQIRVDQSVLRFVNASFKTGITVTFSYANGI